MGNYIKYEIKGTYKFILGIIAILCIAFTIIQLNVENADGQGALLFFSIILPGLVIFGAYITAFFYIVGGFRKELYEDRGYLTFSLPLSGNQILGAKILVAALWFFSIGALVAVYNIILAIVLHLGDLVFKLNDVIKFMGKIQIGTLAVVFVLSCITTLIMIYFSIALSRVTIKNKKVGGLWFVLFLVMSSLYEYLSVQVSKLLPYYFDFANLKMASINGIMNSNVEVALGSPIITGNVPGEIYVGIASLLLTIAIGVGMFIGTGHLIEKKIDL